VTSKIFLANFISCHNLFMTEEEFEKLVAGAIEALPAVGKKDMKNVVFIVEPEVRREKAN